MDDFAPARSQSLEAFAAARGKSHAGKVRIGISGWRYAPWRGVFYPRGLRQADELHFAARHFDTIEINGSFYSLQRPELYTAWRKATGADFVFAVKGSRYITHMKRLRDVETPLANFWASGVLCLSDKLGPILWQFPATAAFDGRFEPFFAALPRTTLEAARLARRHDARVLRPAVRARRAAPIRHAVEIRHESFLCPEFIELLRRYGIALVIADSAGRFPYLEDITADFIYVRLHGDTELYTSGYARGALERWAERLALFRAGRQPSDAVRVASTEPAPRRGRDVYVYFDNDAKVHAPFDAIELAKLVGGEA